MPIPVVLRSMRRWRKLGGHRLHERLRIEKLAGEIVPRDDAVAAFRELCHQPAIECLLGELQPRLLAQLVHRFKLHRVDDPLGLPGIDVGIFEIETLGVVEQHQQM